MPSETFPSKKDTWLLVVLLGGIAVALVAAAIALRADPRTWPLALLIVLVAVGLPCWLLFSTHYTLSDEALMIRSGPFRWQIPIREISAMTPTRNPLSSPALSLERLRIEYGSGKAIMISPTDKDVFIRAVNQRRHSAR
ncbi:MAG: PH domain-containing protein [Burkholderiaceae bacterium]